MREQLIQYVNLLFAGAQDADEIRAEILQNTLDRYDDLVAQGKSPEAAYRLAISGIGDISEMDEIGFEDYVYGEGVSLIEWANLIEEILPETYTQVTIVKNLEKGFDYRLITIEEITK